MTLKRLAYRIGKKLVNWSGGTAIDGVLCHHSFSEVGRYQIFIRNQKLTVSKIEPLKRKRGNATTIVKTFMDTEVD